MSTEKVVSDILDLISFKHEATKNDPEYREGFDTLLKDIDKEAKIILDSYMAGFIPTSAKKV